MEFLPQGHMQSGCVHTPGKAQGLDGNLMLCMLVTLASGS